MWLRETVAIGIMSAKPEQNAYKKRVLNHSTPYRDDDYEKEQSIRSFEASLALACAAAFVALPTHAQEGGLEEVIVTATKRAESLQEVGMSVTAISEKDIENMGIDSYLDFAVRIPNLGTSFQSDGRFDANSPALRGVFGSGDKSSSATTGFYIDDVPVTAALQPRVLDLERIEVLRGPQGSLYGARSMGGTIRLITQQPDLEESSGAVHVAMSSVSDGGENYNFDGHINVPLVEGRAGLRVAAYYGSISGIYDRVYDPTWFNYQTGEEVLGTTPAFARNEDVDDEDYYGGQISLKWMATDNLSITPKFMYQKIEADGLPFADIDAENMETPRYFDSEEPGEDEWWIGSIVINWSMDGGDLTSTTAYYERDVSEFEEEHTFLDFIYGAAVGIPITPLESTLETTSSTRTSPMKPALPAATTAPGTTLWVSSTRTASLFAVIRQRCSLALTLPSMPRWGSRLRDRRALSPVI